MDARRASLRPHEGPRGPAHVLHVGPTGHVGPRGQAHVLHVAYLMLTLEVCAGTGLGLGFEKNDPRVSSGTDRVVVLGKC